MIPHTLRFIVTIDIDSIGYQELLKQGYSESQIETFIKQKIGFAFDLRKLGIASNGITLESDDEYTIIRKPLPIAYSNVTSEGNDVRTIKPTETVRDSRNRNEEELPITQREW